MWLNVVQISDSFYVYECMQQKTISTKLQQSYKYKQKLVKMIDTYKVSIILKILQTNRYVSYNFYNF